MKIALGIPNTGSIRAKTMLSVVGTIFETPHPIHLIEQGGCYVQENRQKIVREAQQAGCDKLFFVDSDMYFAPGTLNALLAHWKPIIGAAYNYRHLPLETTVKFADADGHLVAKAGEDIPRLLFPCYAVGTGCCLVDLAIFDHLGPPPWFECDYDEDGALRTGDDVWFCRLAHQAGYEVWCDPTLAVSHLGEYEY